MLLFVILFFFSSRRRHTRSLRDWSSDVCSSDLSYRAAERGVHRGAIAHDRVRRGGEEGEGEDAADAGRSEERRVGKECRSRWSAYHYKNIAEIFDNNDYDDNNTAAKKSIVININ